MKYVGLGLFWVVFIYIALKILAWIWPLVVTLAEAGFLVVSWGLAILVAIALLWIVGKALS